MKLAVLLCTLGTVLTPCGTSEHKGFLTDGPDIVDCFGGNFTHAAQCYKKARPPHSGFEWWVEFNVFLDEWAKRGREGIRR